MRDISENRRIKNEKDSKLNLEGPDWASDPFNSVPVYRLFFPYARNSASSHHYTTDANEKSILTTNYGWRYEGIGWYGCS